MSVVRGLCGWHTQIMKRQTLAFIALVITILYGVGFAAFDAPQAYAALGGAVVAISWIAVGVFERDDARGTTNPVDGPPRD